VFAVRYELVCYIPEDGILHSHCRENYKSYIALTAVPKGNQVNEILAILFP
jgi:hypothetical protein